MIRESICHHSEFPTIKACTPTESTNALSNERPIPRPPIQLPLCHPTHNPWPAVYTPRLVNPCPSHPLRLPPHPPSAPCDITKTPDPHPLPTP
ncbi:hypothetical protein BGS_0326 [Beggiatoa sp. SS]|nr:hypothetical protein BGS_0326 [Beggiatoa sp. SS]